MKNTLFSTLSLAVTAAAAIALAPPAQAQDACCFNNFRFAGGCRVRPTGGETCAGILAYLNSFDGEWLLHRDIYNSSLPAAEATDE